MEHWQVLELLMVAGFWSEITQDGICQIKNDLVFKKEGMLPQWELFWWFFSSWQLEGQPKMELFSYQRMS
jgi:hypothetical protein